MSLIEVDDLVVEYATRDRTVRALDGVSVEPGSQDSVQLSALMHLLREALRR